VKKDHFTPTETHAFVVRIWLEPNLTRSDGRMLWRGRVQHATSGEYLVFEVMADLLRFITSWTGTLEEGSSLVGDKEEGDV
jgi:hypothetical protein